ncbi:MAG TPA: hypothetical protein VF585_07150 [Chthoniobacterales bacterium]|jgi:hypothetical protein
MNTDKIITYLQLPPEVEALQFESLIETYVELGLNRAQASAAAQADYLCSNILAFRRRGAMDGGYLLVGSGLRAA